MSMSDSSKWPRDENGLRLNPDLFLNITEDEPLLQHYQMLHDGLSDMIEDGRITGSESDIQWLVRMLVNATTISNREAEV